MNRTPAPRLLSAAIQSLFDDDSSAQQIKRGTKFVPAALLCLAMTPVVSFAQSAAQATTLPEVQVQDSAVGEDYAAGASSVGAKTPTPLRDIPQVVNVVPRAVMDAQQANTLTEALRYVPGITLSAGEGGAIGDNINLRGQSARTDIFLNGFRDRGQYTRDSFFIESVEVLKGPSSLFFGRGSTGGVINQVSKEPSLRAHNEVGLTAGTEDYYRGTVDINRPMTDTSAFRIAAMAHTNHSTRDVVEAERFGVAPSLRFGIGTPTTVTLSSVHLRSEEIPDLGISTISSDPAAPAGTKANPAKPFDVDHDNFYGFTDDYFDQDVDAVTARIEHKFSSNLRLRNQTQFSSTRIDTRATNFNRTSLERSLRTREIDDTSLYNQTDLIAKFDTGGIRHTVVAGVEIGRDEYERTSFGPNNTGVIIGDINHPVYAKLPAGFVQTPTSEVETDANTLAVYLNDQVELSKQWKVVGGLRYDRFRADQETTTIATGDVVKIDQNDEMLSGRAGIVYQPTSTQSYYVSYGTSFNPAAETISISAANESVDPEKNRSYEVGGKWDLLDGNLSLTAALFRIEKTDARTEDPITGDVVLAGETRTDGAELGFTGRILPNWQVFGGYTYLDGEVREDGDNTLVGNTLLNTPEHNFTLWTTYRITPEWELGGGFVHVSERMLNNTNTAKVDGYTRYDLTLAYRQKDYDIRLNVLNLADKEYFEAASSGRAVPAQGRTALVTATYRF
jgi:catecholate siderophore receptor